MVVLFEFCNVTLLNVSMAIVHGNKKRVYQHYGEFLQFPVHVPTSVDLVQVACVYVQPEAFIQHTT